MKSWQILIIAIFFIIFLLLGKIYNEEEVVLDEQAKNYVNQEISPEKDSKVDSDNNKETEVASPGPINSFIEKLNKVSDRNIQTVFSQVEKTMKRERDPSIFLVKILQLENQKPVNSYLNMTKGFAIDSFFHRLEEKSDFLPGPPVQETLIQLVRGEKSIELAVEAGDRLIENFGYNRHQIIEFIDTRVDRDQFLENLIDPESN